MSVGVEKRLITVEEYHKMAEAGILTQDDRVELINGEIYTMSPITSMHAAHVKRIRTYLQNIFGAKVTLGVQDPIVIGNDSEPEPDISILHFRDDFYAEKHPTPKQVYFLIEVSLSTVRFDRSTKGQLYAAGNIPEYWMVNLEEEQIEVYRQPSESGYAFKQIYKRGDFVFLEKFDLKIEVSKMLG